MTSLSAPTSVFSPSDSTQGPVDPPVFFNPGENNHVILRFLQSNPSEERNFISRRFYKIRYKNRVYAEHSLVDINQKDPVYEYTNVLYEMKKEAEDRNDGAEVERLRRIINTGDIYKHKGLRPICQYYSNVMIEQDQNDPSNEGCVFVLRFGKTIWRMLKDVEKKKFNAYNLYQAPLFHYIAEKKDTYIDVTKSYFDTSNLVPLSEHKEQIYNIIENYTHPLENLGIRRSYKKYNELKNKFIFVLGESYYENINVEISRDNIVKSPSEKAADFLAEVKQRQQKKLKNV